MSLVWTVFAVYVLAFRLRLVRGIVGLLCFFLYFWRYLFFYFVSACFCTPVLCRECHCVCVVCQVCLFCWCCILPLCFFVRNVPVGGARELFCDARLFCLVCTGLFCVTGCIFWCLYSLTCCRRSTKGYWFLLPCGLLLYLSVVFRNIWVCSRFSFVCIFSVVFCFVRNLLFLLPCLFYCVSIACRCHCTLACSDFFLFVGISSCVVIFLLFR